jgi:hypothetical protein
MSDIINVFIAIILTFATMSLVASTVTEALSSALKWRSTTLVTGLKELLNDPQLQGYAKEILDHASVNPRAPGPVTVPADKPAIQDTQAKQKLPETMPSYIPPLQFASAFLDVIQSGSGPVAANAVAQESLKASIDNIPDEQLKILLQGIYARAGGNIQQVRDELAKWFDSSMDRVSGVYKRKTQLVSFLVALFFTILLNVSVVRVAETIWAHPNVAGNLTQLSRTDETGLEALQRFKAADFPFGWAIDLRTAATAFRSNPVSVALSALLAAFGWVVTAIATLFGAPFWFDTLQRFTRLSGTGPKPDPQPDQSLTVKTTVVGRTASAV